MNHLDRIQRGIDYIEAHLDQTLSANDIAAAAAMSRWHYQRVFKALTNETLKTYVRSRRLANSLHRLVGSRDRIIDIALLAGFESQESFTRAFKRIYRLTPNEYRTLGQRNLFVHKLQFDTKYLRHINSNLSLKPNIYQQAPMRLVGMKTSYYSTDSDKNNIGEKLPSLWNEFLPRLDEVKNRVKNKAYGVIVQTPESELLEYYAAVEVITENPTAGPPPEAMVALSFAGGQYARFQHRGDPKEINNTVNFIYASWLLQVQYQHSCSPDLEVYGDDYAPDSPDSIIHYAIPIL